MQETNLKITDYIMCFLIADTITAGIFSGSIFLLTYGVVWYILYENLKKKGIL
jgi:hypothetical protein